MQILTVLSAIGKVETAVGEYYQWLSEIFADDSEASGFFFRMSMQEKSHANLVSFAKKLAHRSPKDFADIDVDLTPVNDLLQDLHTFRQNHPNPSIAEALAFSMQIEGHDAESIHRTLVIQSNPEIAGIINSLAKADSEHFQMLETFAHQRALREM